jgi:hypothetical protein
LLKPFLYTGKKNEKKPVIGKLSDNWVKVFNCFFRCFFRCF